MELHKKSILILLCILLVVAIVFLGVRQGRRKELLVGKSIRPEDITAFYYTVASSTDPPMYLRYELHNENGTYTLFHEQRAGDHFPLTEADTTIADTISLTPAQWNAFLALFQNGIVTRRTQSDTTGDDGPFLYLYHKNDKGKYQAFAFESPARMQAFVQLCESLSR